MITGKDLIDWGYKPGRWFAQAIAAGNAVLAQGGDDARARQAVDDVAPRPPPQRSLRAVGDLAHVMNIGAETDDEHANIRAVDAHMSELMRVPTIVAGSVMPDAMPSSSALGTIPVGGVVAAKMPFIPACIRRTSAARWR